MSQLLEIKEAQKSLEDCFSKRMLELEAQIQGCGPAKDTVAKVAEEFRAFRELTFSMLSILRSQINECTRLYDTLETRHRRKVLIFSGIAESDDEDCKAVIIQVLQARLSMKTFTVASIKSCHRLGNASNNRPRPILVRFRDLDDRTSVWKAKKGLKGSSISIKEFLTKPRQSVFGRARLHFGMRSCWTQDGIIVIKTPDGNRVKILCMEELNPLLEKYPKNAETSSRAVKASVGVGTSGVTAKNVARKN